LASPVDYYWLKDMLTQQGNKVDFQEYPLGHLGLVIPKDPRSNNQMLKIICEDWGVACE